MIEDKNMYLSVKTRGDSPIRDKSKIFIACCNDKKDICVEQICRWIFKIRNYAIYYMNNMDERTLDENYENIKKMNCIMIPVFSKEFEKDVIAPKIYQFAVNNNIPVVTILMDSEDTADFYEKYQLIYGNLQMLFPYNDDNTKRPFEQVLVQYIEKSISNDIESYRKYQQEGFFTEEIDKEIREEFRGNIFLSYRKKNRKNINKLLQKIRNEKELLDIMFWYDEYLIPGENFDKELQEEIIGCDYVLLLVTPDILAEGNYVLMQEYPMACRLNKKIIAFEAELVDEGILRKKFPRLDYYIHKEEVEKLLQMLVELFREEKGEQKTLKGKRAFMLGKAYLDGKLVEINRKIGVNLIRISADNGFLPALKMISNLYKFGNGVNKDSQKQLRWINKYEKALNDNIAYNINRKNSSNYSQLIETNQREGNICLKEGRFEDALLYYKKMFQASRELCLENEQEILGKVFLVKQVLACNNIANVYLYMKNYEQARFYLEFAIKIYEEAKTSTFSLGGKSALTETWKFFGRLEDLTNHKCEAIVCYKKALGYIEDELDINAFSEVNYLNKCEIYELMGMTYTELGEFESAMQAYKESLFIARKFNAEYANSQSQICIMRVTYAIGKLYKECNQIEKAIDSLKQALSIAEKLTEKEKNFSSYSDVFMYSLDVAKCLYSVNQIKEAGEYLKKAEDMLKYGIYCLINSDDIITLFMLYGNVSFIQNKPATARLYYKKMRDCLEKNFARYHDLKSLMGLGSAYYKLATAHKYVTDWDSIKNGCLIYRTLVEKQPDNLNTQNLYSKIKQLRSNGSQASIENRKKIKSWVMKIFNTGQLLEQYGFKYSEDLSLNKLIISEIFDMVIKIMRDTSEIDDVVKVLEESLGINFMIDDFWKEYFLMLRDISEKSDSSLTGIPEAIRFTNEIMLQTNNGLGDYHEDYSFSIRIVMWSIGEWILNIIEADDDQRKEFVDYFDRIDLFLETQREN